jgi:S1-C subfamily serine protease
MEKSKNILISAVSGALSAVLMTSIIFGGFLNDPSDVTQENSSEVAENSTEKDSKLIEQDLIVEAVKKATPAVVSIIITKDVPVLEKYYEDFGSPFFQIPQYRESGETEEKEIGGGSGFLVSEDGYIVTNKHVVDEEDASYTVFTDDGEKYEAEVIDKDSMNDIAVLKIEGEGFSFLEFGDSDNLNPGQTVIAIGNPLMEFENSVSVGVVSGLSRNITAGKQSYGQTEYLEGVIQTDAAINPGNSGGPLLDIFGKVIGVNVAVASAENIGFSIPSESVEKIVESVKENGRIVRPFLGVRYIQITDSLVEKNNLSVDYGVLILRGETVDDLAVIPGSPADKAGLEENDIILEADGEKLDGTKSLAKIISSKSIGDEVKLKILHKGEEKEVKITLEESAKH